MTDLSTHRAGTGAGPGGDFAACIEACQRCATACDHCATACLGEDDIRMMAACIRLDMDCAQMCRLTAGALARGSDLAGRIAALCADICDACGEECGQHAHDHCRECAEACRRCVVECRKVADRIPGGQAKNESRAGAH